MTSHESPRSEASKARLKSENMVANILEELNRDTLTRIRHNIEEYDGGVTLHEFLRIMKQHIPYLKERDLYELFQEVDINGDGTLEWSELNAYIIQKSSTYLDSVSNSFHVEFRENDRFNTNQHSAADKDILKILYIDELDTIVVIRNHSLVISLYDARDTDYEVGRLSGYVGYPLSCEYVPVKRSAQRSHAGQQAGFLVVACSNFTIAVWGLATGTKQYDLVFTMPTRHVQTSLMWIEKHNILLSTSVAGTIHFWDLDTKRESGCIDVAHEDIATSSCFVPCVEYFATAGMDKRIKLWDIHTCALKETYEGHTSGVVSVIYNSSLKLLLSAGIDHRILIWNPFSSICVFELVGHQDPLVDIRNVYSTEFIVISADSAGIFKVWDLRNYKCLQTFTDDQPHQLKNMTSFDICSGYDVQRHGPPRTDQAPYLTKIVAGTTQLHLFEQRDPVSLEVTENLPIIALKINTEFFQIITATVKRVRIWDMLTGKLIREYDHIIDSDISCMSVDNRQRKIILGTHHGDTLIYNYSSGALLNQTQLHKGEISSVCYCYPEHYILSVSWDRNIILYDPMQKQQQGFVRKMERHFGHEGDITYTDRLQEMIVTVSADQYMILWDFESGKLLGKRKFDAAFVCVKFLSRSLILAAMANGLILLVDCPLFDSSNKEREVRLIQIHSSDSDKPATVTAICFDAKSKMLVFGDDFGSLHCWKFIGNINGSVADLPADAFEDVWTLVNFHDQGVTAVDVAFGIVVSGGYDCGVYAHSLSDAEFYGQLVHGAGRIASRSRFWDVPFDAQLIDWENFTIPEEKTSRPGRHSSKAGSVARSSVRRQSNVSRRSSVVSRKTHAVFESNSLSALEPEQKDEETDKRKARLERAKRAMLNF